MLQISCVMISKQGCYSVSGPSPSNIRKATMCEKAQEVQLSCVHANYLVKVKEEA